MNALFGVACRIHLCVKNYRLNTRIYIKKKESFDGKSIALNNELKHIGIECNIKSYVIYDIFNATEEALNKLLASVFTDPTTDVCLQEVPQHQYLLPVEYLPGQFDSRAEAAMQCCQLLLGHNNILVQTATLYGIDECNETNIESIKRYLINEVDAREKDLSILQFPAIETPNHEEVIDNFNLFDHESLVQFLKERRLSIDIDDLICIQDYFKSENRHPTITEIKAIDTYWSDHCRHTTFLTHLQNISFEGAYKNEMEKTFQRVLDIKKSLGKEDSAITLMELATMLPKYFNNNAQLSNYHLSKENNAATIEVDVDVCGENEKWILLFKNETHNHPTEIEPFGGAATCIGGAIRDPLSGRAFVYQAMRVSGAGDPLEKLDDTLPSKLPQQKISKEATLGYSSYGNQIGVPTSLVTEFYHEGYKAKRFECGFVVGAVKKALIKEEDPLPGDIILLIGGDTGRDGIGGASGSSLEHDESSIQTMQAEVQKGNAITERKIQKLFKRSEAIQLIKKCNDFGAGGICVAIGEIAPSVTIDLNKVPLKYQGLNGTEIALSESQERMAVVVNSNDVSTFCSYAAEENLKATPVATVTDDGYLKMIWNEAVILNLKRSFLNTNGAVKKMNVVAKEDRCLEDGKNFFHKNIFFETLANKNIASQKGMIEHFDSTVLGNTCLMPFGGKYQMTPSDVSAHFICDGSYTTSTASIASWGYHPAFTSANTYLGGMYAVIESISKIVCAGGHYSKVYLSFQEYFEKLGTHPEKWGKPFAALLGAFEAQYQIDVAAIGGKDSMSGTFKDLSVPPTLVSFAVTTENASQLISTEFKSANHFIYLFQLPLKENKIPNWTVLKSYWNKIYEGIQSKKIVAAKHVKDGGIATAIAQMSFGNQIGAEIYTNLDLLNLQIGSIIIESTEMLSGDFHLLGKTTFSKILEFNRIPIPIEEAQLHWTKTFEKLFPTKTSIENTTIPPIVLPSKKIKNIGWGKPNVFIPVFPGTNCEYETIDAFTKEQANVQTHNFINLSEKSISNSIQLFSEQIRESQILVLSGGFSAADEPDGSAKYIVNVLKNEYIKDSLHKFLDYGGLILGICNGFQALIKSGLLPYGAITDSTMNAPTLTYNHIGRHVSQMVTIKVVNDHSPWLQGMLGQTYIVPVSHGEGRFVANDLCLQNISNQHQIATQYVDECMQPTLQFPFNPNGSVYAVEGLISKNGQIFGRMAHPERMKNNRFKNIPNIQYQNIFKNGVDYFL